jgi:hypothetical protein
MLLHASGTWGVAWQASRETAVIWALAQIFWILEYPFQYPERAGAPPRPPGRSSTSSGCLPPIAWAVALRAAARQEKV